MLKKVQAFFLFSKKNFYFYLILFFSFCTTNNFKKQNFNHFLFQESCMNELLIPNIKMFKKSLLRPTLSELTCNTFKELEKFYPMLLDGISIASTIFIKTDCIFDKNEIPIKLNEFNPYIKLWNYHKNEFSSLKVIYKENQDCGFIVIPEQKLNESSYYLFLFQQRGFDHFLKKELKLNSKDLWKTFKNNFVLNKITKDQENLLVNIIDSYSKNYYFNPDETIYSVFSVRSYSGIFAPFLYFRDQRKHVEMNIIKKEILLEESKFGNGNVYKIQFKEKKQSNISIPYIGMEENFNNLNYHYHNYLKIYIPEKVKNDSINILITNGDIISLPFFKELSNKTNTIIINYYVFKDKYLNLMNELLIYDNIYKILNQFIKNFYIIKINKICFYDLECIISTFYEDKIENVFVYKIPEYFLDSYNNNYYYDANLNMTYFIKEKFTFTEKEIKDILSQSLKEDIFRIYLYTENKKKLKNHLNYNFSLRKINFLFSKEEYINYLQ